MSDKLRVRMKGREEIRNMFSGRCAYCGKPLGKIFHIDHIRPLYRGYVTKPPWAGEDKDSNRVPACPRCNRRKAVLTVEQFRQEIQMQTERLHRQSAAYRLAKDYDQIKETNNKVIFYMERGHPNQPKEEPK